MFIYLPTLCPSKHKKHLYIHYLYDQRSCHNDTTADRIGCKSPGLKLLVEFDHSFNTLAEDIETEILVW